MPSKERQILERVKTQIQNVNGSGSYSYELSSSDRVVFGDRFAPEALPCAYVNLIDINTAQDPGRTVLTRYDRTMQIQIEAWTAVTSSTAGQSILEGCDLMDDIMRALEDDRTLNNLARDVEIRASAFDGQAHERPGLALASIVCSIFYTERAGA